MLSVFASIPWTADPILAHLGPLLLRWYGILFALGFVIGSFVLTHIYKKEGVRPYWVDVITFYMVVGTVLGARLGHVFFYDWDKYKDNLWDIFKIWEGGLASHGATIGILLATFIFSVRNKFDYLWVLDRIVIVVAIGGACIRIGNLMNSEIVGKPADVPWAFVFPRDTEHLQPATHPLPAGAVQVAAQPVTYRDGTSGYQLLPEGTPVTSESPMAVPRHPTQIYESLFCIVLLALLYGLWNKYKEKTPRGLLFGLFVVLLFTFRLLIEFLKENQVAFENHQWLNQGQRLSLPFIFIGIGVLVWTALHPHNYGYAPRDLAEEEAAQAAAATKS